MPMSLGPGTLKIGSTGTAIDASCLVNGARIEPSVDRTDSTKKLCGSERPGTATYSAVVLSGNIDNDADADNGLFELSWANAGSIQPFEFTPNDEAGATATGQLVIDPMTYGADAYGDDLVSDISWTIFGDILMTPIVGTPYTLKLGATAAVSTTAATGATAGTPGVWTPSGTTPPASLSALQSASPAITASPNTAWTTGQYVQTGTAGTPGQAHWSGSAWVTGAA